MNESRISSFYACDNIDNGERKTVPVPPPIQTAEDLAEQLFRIRAQREAIEAREERLADQLLGLMLENGHIAVQVQRLGTVQVVPGGAHRTLDEKKAQRLIEAFGHPVPFVVHFAKTRLAVQLAPLCQGYDRPERADEDDEEPSTRREGMGAVRGAS